jgi:WD40 repeat protein
LCLNSTVIKIWSLTGGLKQLPTVINRLGHDPHPIFWSPDGLKLADVQYVNYSSASGTNVLAFWDTRNGKLLSRHDGMTMGAWSLDGKKMVVNVGTKYGSSLQIVNPDTFQTLFTFPSKLDDGNYAPYQIWTHDSHQVIGSICNSGKCTLWIWDAQTGQVDEHFDQLNQNGVIVGDNWIANSILLNKSGTLLAAATLNRVYLWDIQSGELLNPLELEDQITSLSWNYTQDILLLGSRDGTIQQWKVQLTP